MMAPPLKLTPRELERCVTLLGCGYTLQQALERIEAERPNALTPARR